MSGLGLGQLAAHGFAKLTGAQLAAGATSPVAATASGSVVLPDGTEMMGSASGTAGGVLSGTYPNPGFAVDMATQAELDAVAASKANTSHTHAVADVTGLQAALDGKEPAIAAGTATQYWRGDKTWRDFFTDVRAATLTGLNTATNSVVAATDTVLAAIGKLQKQVSAKFDKDGGNISGHVTLSGDLLAYGNVLAISSGVLGFGVGAGGTVVQSGSVTTPVSLNTPNGVITLMGESIYTGNGIEFALYNDRITEESIVIAHGVFDWTTQSIMQLTVRVEYVRSGQAIISVKNISAITADTDSVKIRFAVFAGSNS